MTTPTPPDATLTPDVPQSPEILSSVDDRPSITLDKPVPRVSNISISTTNTVNRSSLDDTKKSYRRPSGLTHRVAHALTFRYNEDELAVLRAKKEHIAAPEILYDFNTDLEPSNSEISNRVRIKKFSDYRPRNSPALEDITSDLHSPSFIGLTPGTLRYFSKIPDIVDYKDGLAVVIPFFNEESKELQQTLTSLYRGFLEVKRLSKKWRDKKMYIVLIQDGWHKSSNSAKEFLKQLFPKKIEGEDWWNYFPEFAPGYKNDDCNATFVFEKENYGLSRLNYQKGLEEDPTQLRITLMVKINNRRKHNSHEWFLARNGFAESVRAKYLFLTDAFTLYSQKCLYYLIHDLDKNPKISGVTGRQRLMTRDQQGSGESIFSFGYVLRMIQLFDFEFTNAVYNGAFHLGGLLPVIPGPCGLYRSSDLLQDNVRDSYFRAVNEEPDKLGLIRANLCIAEDRVLSYYSVTKTAKRRYMAFNPLAVFYFEAETSLQQFLLQRRRWINGSVAGYIYLLFSNFTDFWNWDAFFLRKIYVYILLFMQFVIYCLVSIVPGISLKIMYYGIIYFMSDFKIENEIAVIGIFMILWVLYVTHVIVHNRVRWSYIIMYLLVALSFLTSIVTFGSLLDYIFLNPQAVNNLIETSATGVLTSFTLSLFLSISCFTLCFVLALFLSGRGHSLMYMIKSFIPYLLFIPLLVGWFGSYAYSRTWDFSWGSRQSGELVNVSAEQRDIMITKFKEKSIRIIICLFIVNVGIFFIPLVGQIWIVSVFFFILLYHMFFSFIYILTKIPYKIRMAIRSLTKKKIPAADIENTL